MSATEEALAKQRAEIVSLLKELRDELTDPQEWTVKRGTWNLAIRAAEGKVRSTKAGEARSEDD